MQYALVLIIEANEATRKLLSETLQKENYQVLEADDGTKALTMLQKFKPDIILQDLTLPDFDGIELNQRLREHAHGKDIPILAIAGFLNRIDEIQETYNGFNSFIVKPISPPHLLNVIKMFKPAIATAQSTGKGKRILIADDDPIQLKFLAFHLEKAGYEVTTAVNGKDALQQAEQNPPDAIISDVLMPELDGFDLCIQVRQSRKLGSIPIILVTNHYIEESDKKLAAQSGANAYISRTSDPIPMIRELSNVLKSESHLTTTVSDANFKTEHISRLVHQLDLQIAANASLARQCAQQTAQLNLLNGIAEALTNKEDINHVLRDILASCLDTAGVSKGILYMINRDDDNLYLRQHIGYSSEQKKNLTDFFGNLDILTEMMDKRRILQLPSGDIHSAISRDILNHSDVKSALIIPLVTMNGCRGVLFLGYKTTGFSKEDLLFAHTLGMHIIQAVSLAETFELLSISEMRYRTLMDCASCGILLHDNRGIIIEMNRHSEEIFLHRKDQIIGRDFNDFIKPEDRISFDKYMHRISSKTPPDAFKCHIQRANGTIYVAEVSIAPVQIGTENLFLAVLSNAQLH